MLSNRIRGFLIATAAAIFFAAPAHAIFGQPDVVPGSSLIVPMFEANPVGQQDTLIVVKNICATPRVVNYEFWDVFGGRVPTLSIDPTIPANGSHVIGMQSFLGSASVGALTQLTDPADGFRRGFISIDQVTAGTILAPTQPGYPFATGNCLEGWIYYVRLAEGSSNGLAAVPLEDVGASPPSGLLKGFYTDTGDNREEIDEQARNCSENLVAGAASPCPLGTNNNLIIDARIFTEAALVGSTRVIIFAWNPENPEPGTPLVIPSASISRFNEAGGAVLAPSSVPLNRVVNILGFPGGPNGNVELGVSLPSTVEVYSFTFNSAKPPPVAGVNLEWDAIFVNPIDTDD